METNAAVNKWLPDAIRREIIKWRRPTDWEIVIETVPLPGEVVVLLSYRFGTSSRVKQLTHQFLESGGWSELAEVSIWICGLADNPTDRALMQGEQIRRAASMLGTNHELTVNPQGIFTYALGTRGAERQRLQTIEF